MNNLFTLLLPLITGIILAFIKDQRTAKYVALLLALISFGATLPFLCLFSADASIQFEQHLAWIPALGIQIHLGLDGISLPFVLLTNMLIPLIILSSYMRQLKPGIYALMSFMHAGLLLVFMALDAFTFYIGWEVSLIPIYFICGLWGEGDRIRVNLKFFVYTFFGSLLMLIAIIYLSQQASSFEWAALKALHLSETAQSYVFWAFFLAFAIKIPIFPFHTWQPKTYTYAPTIGTMLLAGIMLKMGVYGLIRWLIPLVPVAVHSYGSWVLILCVIGIVYASIIALKQQDTKQLIAYSSIAHVGLIAAGIFAWNQQGLQGAIMQMFNHGISVIGLFLVLDIISNQTQTRQIHELGGIATRAPKLAALFLVIIMGAIGLPLTNGFIGEFLLLIGIFNQGVWYAAAAGLTLILGAIYMLRLFQKTMLGKVSERTAQMSDVGGSELLTLLIIAGLILYLGIFPNTFLHLSEAAVNQLLVDFSTVKTLY